MRYTVRVSTRIDDDEAPALANEAFDRLLSLDDLADMATGIAVGSFSFWTTVDADTPESAILLGAQRVREALTRVMPDSVTRDGWPPRVHPVGLEVYSETDTDDPTDVVAL